MPLFYRSKPKISKGLSNWTDLAVHAYNHFKYFAADLLYDVSVDIKKITGQFGTYKVTNVALNTY